MMARLGGAAMRPENHSEARMISFLALALFSCTRTVQETEYFDYPVMNLSVSELDLEEVELGEKNTERFTIKNAKMTLTLRAY